MTNQATGEYCAKGVILAAHQRKIDYHEASLGKIHEYVGRMIAECEAAVAASTRASEDSRASRVASESAERHARVCFDQVDRVLQSYQSHVSSAPPREQMISITEDELGDITKVQLAKQPEVIVKRMRKAESRLSAANIRQLVMGLVLSAGAIWEALRALHVIK